MSAITLINSTDNERVDALIRGVIGVLERLFPERIRGYYLVGSYADGTYVPGSDLDIVPIFKGSISPEEETAFRDVIDDLDLISPIRLGFGLRNEEQSFSEGGVGITIGSTLLYGEDVRDQIPLWPLDYYLQQMIGAHVHWLLSFRGHVSPLRFPLTYPDPEGEFYGYVHAGTQANETPEPETSSLFGHVMVMASTLVTLKSGEYNASKSLSYEFYRRHINDEWSSFLETFYEKCKKTWQYHIPAAVSEQETLRTLCGQTLAFENHFLQQIKPYLILQRDQGSSWAAEQLTRIVFPSD